MSKKLKISVLSAWKFRNDDSTIRKMNFPWRYNERLGKLEN